MLRSLFATTLIVCACHCPNWVALDAAEGVTSHQQRALAERLLAAYVFVGSGSGVLVSADGLIVSNHHVTGEDSPQTVYLQGGQSFTATLLGVDPVGDIAVLKIDHHEPLPFVPLAGASDLRLGMPVFAVGNPFALGDRDYIPSLSTGSLSSLRVVRGNYADCIQIDAPVNPGNSGGPLLSMDGKLLGINGQIRTRSGMRINSGIGLAIAATQLAEFIPVLATAKGGYAHHAAIPSGIEVADQGGEVVIATAPEDHQLQQGDQLLTINGRAATSAETAEGLFQAPVWHPGRTLPVTILRNGQQHTFDVAVDRTPIPGRPWHGIAIRMDRSAPIPENLTATYGEGRLAKVRTVDADSPAELAGISTEDWLLSINEVPLLRPLDLIRAVADQEVGDHIDLRLLNAAGEIREVSLLLRPRP